MWIGDRSLRRRLFGAAWLTALSFPVPPRTDDAQVRGDIDDTETLRHVLGLDGMLLTAGLGAAPGTLSFVSATDPGRRTFSYFVSSGQYGGLPVTMAANGGFNPATGRYEWTGTGQRGDQRWTTSGSAAWSLGDGTADVLPAEDPIVAVIRTEVITDFINGVQWDGIGFFRIEVADPTRSSGRGVLFGPGGRSQSGDVEDWLVRLPDGTREYRWDWKAGVQPPIVLPTAGRIEGNDGPGGRGFGTITIDVVPEPGSAVLVLAGLGAWGVVAARRRSGRRASHARRPEAPGRDGGSPSAA